MDLRSQIQCIALRWPAYGYRSVHAELRRHGWSGFPDRAGVAIGDDWQGMLPETPTGGVH
jgi:hypothetical protein